MSLLSFDVASSTSIWFFGFLPIKLRTRYVVEWSLNCLKYRWGDVAWVLSSALQKVHILVCNSYIALASSQSDAEITYPIFQSWRKGVRFIYHLNESYVRIYSACFRFLISPFYNFGDSKWKAYPLKSNTISSEEPFPLREELGILANRHM